MSTNYTINWPAKVQALLDWQRNVMGNHCTVCHNHNVYSLCAACGWWGFVAPDDVVLTDDQIRLRDEARAVC